MRKMPFLALLFVLLSVPAFANDSFTQIPTEVPKDNAKLLDIKLGYFEQFPDDEGYDCIGAAFDRFFQKPIWKMVKDDYDVLVPGFSGIAMLGDQPTKFLITFKCPYEYNRFVTVRDIYGNGDWIYSSAYEGMLGTPTIDGCRNSISAHNLIASIYLK